MRPPAPGHASALGALTALFAARVLGQALVAFLDAPLLPPMSAWYSGLLPYPILLPPQLLILAVQLRIDAQVWRGRGVAFMARPRAGRALQWLSYAYALSMVARWAVTRSHVIPIVFHWVLAASLWVLGRLWTRQAPGDQARSYVREAKHERTTPMQLFVIAMSLVVVAPPALASISSGSSGPVVVVAVPAPRTVAVALAIPAHFVSVPIKVISEQKNSALAYEESRQAIETIYQRAKANGQFRASTGVACLSQHNSACGISYSGSWSQPAAAADIYLVVPLTKERDDIFAAGAEAARFVDALRLPGKARCELGRLQLAVDNPEQYRAKLLGLIAEEITKARATLSGSGTVKLEGLQSPVMVRQVDDRNVELFLNYSLSITTEK